ncbi:MAG: SDR family oxidoreductase [Pseudomonadota bacterium]
MNSLKADDPSANNPVKRALVTGAARGIGLASADLFAEAGWSVVLLDWDGDELAKVAAQRPDMLALEADVSDPKRVVEVAKELAETGDLNALVNNAGVADFGPIAEHDFARWRHVMAVNLDGPFLMSQALAPLLQRGAERRDKTSAIVNVASISGIRASTLRVAYGTSKAGVIHLTKQQAVEMGELGIRANCVAPGPVDTKLALAVHTPAIRKAYHDCMPLNRYGTEREIAEAIVFLASDKASFITGQLLNADGGFDQAGVGLPALRE